MGCFIIGRSNGLFFFDVSLVTASGTDIRAFLQKCRDDETLFPPANIVTLRRDHPQ